MKVFSVAGYTKSGKTTTIEAVIKELKGRGYTVGSVKDIHYEQFAMDTEGTNTHRHKVAGAQLVTARGPRETDVLFQERLDVHKIASFYETDWLVLEGVREANVPMILTADSIEDLDERYDGRVFMVSGKIADQIHSYKGLPAISAFEDIEALVDRIEAKAFPLLPEFDPKCVAELGYNARQACCKILAGDLSYEAAVSPLLTLSLKIDGKPVHMVPFVQKILENALLGVVSELDGYRQGAKIEVSFSSEAKNDE